MTRPPLSQTLTALIEGVTPSHPGLAVEEAEIDLPLIVKLETEGGKPVLTAQPPYSPYHQGLEPVFHRARIRIEHVVDDSSTTPATFPAPLTVE